MTIGTERCLCIMELNVTGIIGIGVELPSSELGFCTGVGIELELLLSELELNCKYGIDPGSSAG